MSPGMRGKRVSSMRMPTVKPYWLKPPPTRPEVIGLYYMTSEGSDAAQAARILADKPLKAGMVVPRPILTSDARSPCTSAFDPVLFVASPRRRPGARFRGDGRLKRNLYFSPTPAEAGFLSRARHLMLSAEADPME